MEEYVLSKLSISRPNDVVAELDRNQCTGNDLNTLNGLTWLNDEVRIDPENLFYHSVNIYCIFLSFVF